MAERRPAGPGARGDRQDPQQQDPAQEHPEVLQGLGGADHRHRLRPRGRAHRGGRGQQGQGSEPGHRGQAGPFLGPHPHRDRARLHQPREHLLRPGTGGRGAAGHRPGVGRQPHPLHLPGLHPPGQAVPLGGPGAEPHPGADSRPRARAQGVRVRQLLDGQGEVRPERGHLHRPAPQGPFRRPERGRGRLRQHRGNRPGAGGGGDGTTPGPAHPLQHHRLPERGGFPGDQRGQGHEHSREPVHERLHQLPPGGQHRLPALPGHAGAAGRAVRHRGPGHPLQGGAVPGEDNPHPGQEGDHRPPAHLSHRAGQAVRASTTRTGRSTSWSSAASWPPCPPRRR